MVRAYLYYFLIKEESPLKDTIIISRQNFLNEFIYFIYFFLAALDLRCGAQASHCGGFSCAVHGLQEHGLQQLWHTAHGLNSCDSWALEHRLSSCGARAQLLCGMWDLPGLELEPVSPALPGGFVTTVPPRKSLQIEFLVSSVFLLLLK